MSWSGGILTADIQCFALLALAHRIVHFAFDNLVVEIPANVMYKLQQSDGDKVWWFRQQQHMDHMVERQSGKRTSQVLI